nr:peroxisomal acyl-coenzyme A oxidase 1-like [Ipomoea batatas]
MLLRSRRKQRGRRRAPLPKLADASHAASLLRCAIDGRERRSEDHGEIVGGRRTISALTLIAEPLCRRSCRRHFLCLLRSPELTATAAVIPIAYRRACRGLPRSYPVSVADEGEKRWSFGRRNLPTSKLLPELLLAWWPGGLDKSAIPIVVYACLITEGFIVQLRSLEDNKPLPGITVLEILE